MNKYTFISILRHRLQALPPYEIDKTIAYYKELIDDHMDAGLSEEDAVACLGDMDDVVNAIFQERSIPNLMRANLHYRMRSKGNWRGMSTGMKIFLGMLCFPLWFPLLVAGFGVVFGLLCAVLAIGIGLPAVLIASGIGLLVALLRASFTGAVFAIGAMLVFGGLSKLLWRPGRRGIYYVIDKIKLGFRVIKDKLIQQLKEDDE